MKDRIYCNNCLHTIEQYVKCPRCHTNLEGNMEEDCIAIINELVRAIIGIPNWKHYVKNWIIEEAQELIEEYND